MRKDKQGCYSRKEETGYSPKGEMLKYAGETVSFIVALAFVYIVPDC